MKLLGIGNSFSDDIFEYSKLIARSINLELDWINMYIGGCSIEKHMYNINNDIGCYIERNNMTDEYCEKHNVKLTNILTKYKWDAITFQQCSQYSGKHDTYKDLRQLVKYVKKLQPAAKLYWNMTWSYQKDSTHPNFPDYKNDQAYMDKCILDCLKGQVVKLNTFNGIVPCGEAIKLARKLIGDKLTRDGYHLSIPFGRYLAGMVLVQTLFNTSVDDVTYMPEGLSIEELKLCKDICRNLKLEL